MAFAVAREMNLRIFSGLLNANKRGKSGNGSFQSFSLGFGRFDSFASHSTSQLLERVVRKIQEANNRQITGVAAQLMFGGGQAASARITTTATELAPPAPPAPQEWEIALGVESAGGYEALAPWLVDGKTKLQIGGRMVVANVTGEDAPAAGSATTREQAEAALKRFGLDASALDGDLSQLRSDLKAAARNATLNDARLAGAVEYALEDAYAKLHTYESEMNGAAAENPNAYEDQRKKNLAQAADVARQLGLGASQAWGVETLAEDLAVFGMDLGAMGKDPQALLAEIQQKSKDMLAELGGRYVGTEAEFVAARNRITGASARLVNGLRSSGGAINAAASAAAMQAAGLSASASVSVKVGGASVSASSIVAMSNVLVDPLVLDLNGDGIDLKSAEEGVDFDMDGDGEKTRMGFIRGDDALLFLDTHGDGVVHDGNQLFGNTQGYANGFEMLAAYDDNGDGVIDERDAIFEQLRLWVEKTEDGVCEASETMSLREAGIKSISLGYQNTREDDGKGNLIGQVGSFTRSDGTQGMTADAWLRGHTR